MPAHQHASALSAIACAAGVMRSLSLRHANYVATLRADALFRAALTGAFRDLDRLPAAFALVLTVIFSALVLRLAFLGPVFLGVVRAFAFFAAGLVLIELFRFLTVLLAERL